MVNTRKSFSLVMIAVAVLATIGLGACSSIETEAKYPTGANRSTTDDIYAKPDSVFGDEGISFLGKKRVKDDSCTGDLGVNAYLWRASLDTISFMPLDNADPFGGTIKTEWYASPSSPKERFQINVYVLSKELRSDGIRVSMFRQVKNGSGQWVDAKTEAGSASKLEDAILTRARELRVSGLEKE